METVYQLFGSVDRCLFVSVKSASWSVWWCVSGPRPVWVTWRNPSSLWLSVWQEVTHVKGIQTKWDVVPYGSISPAYPFFMNMKILQTQTFYLLYTFGCLPRSEVLLETVWVPCLLRSVDLQRLLRGNWAASSKGGVNSSHFTLLLLLCPLNPV